MLAIDLRQNAVERYQRDSGFFYTVRRRHARLGTEPEECFPRSARQRCLAHRMRNLAVKVPTDLWPEFKTRVAACYQAPSRAIARDLANGIRSDYAATLPSAVSCFEDDFEAYIAQLS